MFQNADADHHSPRAKRLIDISAAVWVVIIGYPYRENGVKPLIKISVGEFIGDLRNSREIDAEIARLQQARALLANGSVIPAVKAKRGRPKGSVNPPAAAKKPAKKAKRTLSPEGRKAIADATKRRWAEKKKAQGK